MYAKLETRNITVTCFRLFFPEINYSLVSWRSGFYLTGPGYSDVDAIFSYYIDRNYRQDEILTYKRLATNLLEYCNGH
jgi:hypothetical protein